MWDRILILSLQTSDSSGILPQASSSGGRIGTYDLQVMSLASYHCSTPGYLLLWCTTAGRRRRGCRRLRSAARMALEHAGRGEFAQLVSHHVFGHEQLHEVLAVVNHERMADEVGH